MHTKALNHGIDGLERHIANLVKTVDTHWGNSWKQQLCHISSGDVLHGVQDRADGSDTARAKGVFQHATETVHERLPANALWNVVGDHAKANRRVGSDWPFAVLLQPANASQHVLLDILLVQMWGEVNKGAYRQLPHIGILICEAGDVVGPDFVVHEGAG